MKTLLKGGSVVNVFTGELEQANVIIEDGIIASVGNYAPESVDMVKDITGKYVCPGFIDGHIHIESTMLTPFQFAKIAVPHGTTAIVADPHEIANVCGVNGIRYMIEASEDLPMTVYYMLPSCVPASAFDESGAVLDNEALEPLYSCDRVLGLAEVMSYPSVIARDNEILKKINSARKRGLTVNGHSPLLSGRALDSYIQQGIWDDHECSSVPEAMERIRKGQRVMIRLGPGAKNLMSLLPLFDEPWARRCLLVTDDKHAANLINNGHLDDIIRRAVKEGKNVITAIRMATLQVAECFGLKGVGAVTPGYVANILVLDDLENVDVCDVIFNGQTVVEDHKLKPFDASAVDETLVKAVNNTVHIKDIDANSFRIEEQGVHKCRVMQIIPNELITNEIKEDIDFSVNNGIDVDRDILKLAVVERHNQTGHIGKCFVKGIGLKSGAIASTVSHDSHNIIIIGTNDADMSAAAKHLKSIGGGVTVIENGRVVADMALPVAGLMSDTSVYEMAKKNEKLIEAVYAQGTNRELDPFMIMMFIGLSVIPHLKITTLGLIDVDSQCIVPLVI